MNCLKNGKINPKKFFLFFQIYFPLMSPIIRHIRPNTMQTKPAIFIAECFSVLIRLPAHPRFPQLRQGTTYQALKPLRYLRR